MNPLTQFKKIPILPLLIGLALVVVAPALATPPLGVTTTFIVGSLTGGFPFDEIDAYVKTGDWKAHIDTKGDSDLYIVRVTFDPLGNTGWHRHPGPSLIMVISGTLTAYDGDDPTCTPHVYPAGTSFVDTGDHVHLVRNESTTEQAVDIAVQLVPAGAPRRIDVTPAPGNCPF
jgi:quercetin dioxygenase-like cupin family protein